MLENFNKFIVQNASRICRLAAISDSGAGEAIVALKKRSQKSPGKIFLLERDGGLDPVYVLDGQQLIFYSKNVVAIDGELRASRLMTNIWDDIAWEGIAGEGNVTFRKGKKPERLIRRVLDLATNPGDLVLDSFLGSGTTAAVAHKMGRRWIGIELGEHCETHCLPRLKKVVDGEDPGGITQAVGWKGGGGFRYYRLAPSLLEKDKWGNWVVSKEYNGAMLAEAVCKLEGFTYEPSDSLYWQHGHSTERDFIYTTTANLSHDQLQELSDEVGPERSLLVVCSAFRGRKEGYPNLTVKKIPNTVLSRCEWGKDDYSLKVENLPKAPPPAGQQELF
jgi:adenine-specific DNA-methyltransferase